MFAIILAACSGSTPEQEAVTTDRDADERGSQTTAEAHEDNLDFGRNDLEAQATAHPGGTSQGRRVDAALRSLDRRSIFDPTLTFVFSDGVTVNEPLPDGCEPITRTGQVVCVLPAYLPDFVRVPTDWIGLSISVDIDPQAEGPKTVTVTATSDDNPITNDPDPTNNTIEIALN